MTELSLGIDIGTTGVRTAVVNKAKEVLSTTRLPHLPQNENQIDAMLWWETVRQCIHNQVEILKGCGENPNNIKHITVNGTSGSMLLADSQLRPVTRALLYNSKGFEKEAEKIAACAPSNHITQGSASALARAMRLHGEDREGRAAHLMHQADFISAQLSGKGGYSDYNNSLKTGFDPESDRWPEWFENLDIRNEILPVVLPIGKSLNQINPTIAGILNLPNDAVIHAGTTDSTAAFLACAPFDEGTAVTSLGTTLAVKILSFKRIDDPHIGLYSHRIGSYWLIGGASNTGGGVLKKFFSEEALISLSDKINPAVKTDLEYYPLPRIGERFPINAPTLKPKMEPRPIDNVDFLRGLLEGIARIEALCYEEIANRGGTLPRKLYTAGGGASNKAWTAIRKRVLKIQPLTSRYNEACVGTANIPFTDFN